MLEAAVLIEAGTGWRQKHHGYPEGWGKDDRAGYRLFHRFDYLILGVA